MLAVREPSEDRVRCARTGATDRTTGSEPAGRARSPIWVEFRRLRLLRFGLEEDRLAANPRPQRLHRGPGWFIVNIDLGFGVWREGKERVVDVLDLPLRLIRARHAHERHRLVVVEVAQLLLGDPNILFQRGDLSVDRGAGVHLLQLAQPLLRDPDLRHELGGVRLEVDVGDPSDRVGEVRGRGGPVFERLDCAGQLLIRGVRQLLDPESTLLAQRHQEVDELLRHAPVHQRLEVAEPVLLRVDLLFHRVDPRPQRGLSVSGLLREVEEPITGLDQPFCDLLQVVLRLDRLGGQNAQALRSFLCCGGEPSQALGELLVGFSCHLDGFRDLAPHPVCVVLHGEPGDVQSVRGGFQRRLVTAELLDHEVDIVALVEQSGRDLVERLSGLV